MNFPKSVWHRHFHALLKLQNPSNHIQNSLHNLPVLTTSTPYKFGLFHPILWLPFSVAAHSNPQGSEYPKKERGHETTKPLSVFFEECVGILEQAEISGNESQYEGENAELVGKLKNLEDEVKSLNNEKGQKEGDTLKPILGNGSGRPLPLWAVFSDASTKKGIKLFEKIDDSRNHGRLSSDMQTFARHLYDEGYFKDANFIHKYTFDLAQFESDYGRGFLKFAALKFGKDHHKIAKWLSASDLKELALFGCPGLQTNTVFAAKGLRKFFEIQEHEVCQKCSIRKSCKLENRILQKPVDKLRLSGVVRVLIAYAMDSSPQNLVVPEKIKNSVSRLLKEAVSLSRAVS